MSGAPGAKTRELPRANAGWMLYVEPRSERPVVSENERCAARENERRAVRQNKMWAASEDERHVVPTRCAGNGVHIGRVGEQTRGQNWPRGPWIAHWRVCVPGVYVKGEWGSRTKAAMELLSRESVRHQTRARFDRRDGTPAGSVSPSKGRFLSR